MLKDPVIGEGLVQECRYKEYRDGHLVFMPKSVFNNQSYEMVFAARVITGPDIVLLSSGEWITFRNWEYRKQIVSQEQVILVCVWPLNRMQDRYNIPIPKGYT